MRNIILGAVILTFFSVTDVHAEPQIVEVASAEYTITTPTRNPINYQRFIQSIVDQHLEILHPAAFTNPQLVCLAQNIYYEARGETLLGQVAIINVTMRRSQEFNKTICQVVYQPNQFSWTNNSHRFPPHGEEWKVARILAWLAMNDREVIRDVTNNSTHFHSNRIRRPPDFRHFQHVVDIGSHRFYRIP